MVYKDYKQYKEEEMYIHILENGCEVLICPHCKELGLTFIDSTQRQKDRRNNIKRDVFDCKNIYKCEDKSLGQCNMYYDDKELEESLKRLESS